MGFAPFLHVSWTPVEQLEVFGGIRWNHDEVTRRQIQQATVLLPASTLDVTERFRETTGELGLKWFVSDDHMLYAKFAHGYKRGFVELDLAAGVVNPVEPELIDAWEIGAKTSWLDGRLQLNLTGFYYDYSELQVPQPLGLQIFTFNAAGATIWGVEAELAALLRPGWLVRITAAHLDATFDEFCADDAFLYFAFSEPGCAAPAVPNGFNGQLNLAGNSLEDAPEWEASLVSRYRIELGEWGSLTSVLVFKWVDEYYARPFNLDVDRIQAHTRTDLRFIWTSPEGRYTVELYGEHLEDETIYGRRVVPPELLGSNAIGLGLFTPRRFGVRMGFRWGGR